jgi:hypothetical protein
MKNSVLWLTAIVITSTGLLAFKYTEPEKSIFDIQYHVNCKACEITYRDEQGNSKDLLNIKSAWSYQFTGEKGQFIYVSAVDEQGNAVKVSITKDGDEFATDEVKASGLSARAGTIL